MIIIMRATLHDHAPNTYYGQWLRCFSSKRGRESRSIARNELAASARVGAFGWSGARFPRESLAAVPEISVSTKKKNRRAWRCGALPATTSPLTASL
jgi:hypothetical protein